MIQVHALTKNYKVFRRPTGFVHSLRSLIYREYEIIEAVKGISFRIDEGEFVGLIGPNGAGKTTVLKMLSGILFPSNGTVNTDGFVPYEKKRPFLRRIAFINAQKSNLWWDLPARDSFLIHQAIYEINNRDFKARIQQLSEMLDVASLLTTPVRNLSLGERMKLEILLSLLHRPRIIFLDEPTIGLDFISRRQIRKFLINYQTTARATIILTSHYFEDITDLCKRLIILSDGRTVVDEPLSRIQEEYKDYRIVRIRSNDLQQYKRQFQAQIVEENLEFTEFLLPTSQAMTFFHDCTDLELEIKPVSLEAIVKKHYEKHNSET
ncbi:MAG: hypothetical protein C5B47_02435 [Verrucomicrobia bacterium]|nr:MAG: hypothetical protein C5B47_02435 [Verrucomicrobiota bacterium]